ncbi:MAG: KOW domain-containing RNA-binding protein [Lachnospiraceae bacterium]|nr:KOW domain-containing RNA-binding protein [Lachnospiraceae bacterium]MBQ6993603.1 KOW domain-containing RNA-binding protein [Lachnospiraceae bacterium]
MTGLLAYSLAGHDKGKIYFIVKEERDYFWLVDGEVRPLENPKKKNKKHVQIIKRNISVRLKEDTVESDIGLKSVTNESIKRTIKLYCKDIQEV